MKRMLIVIVLLACGEDAGPGPIEAAERAFVRQPCCECLARTELNGYKCADIEPHECPTSTPIRTGCGCLEACYDDCKVTCD